HDLVDQSDALGFLGSDDPTGQDQLLGARRPDDSWQALSPTAARQHCQAHLGHAQPGASRRDAQIATQGQLEPSAQGIALDRGDRRHGQPREFAIDELLEEQLALRDPASEAFELADVGTGAEGALPAPRHDHGADAVRCGEAGQCLAQLFGELARDEVQWRVDELEVRHAANLERDELAHDAARKSAARPIGPVAYNRRSMVRRSSATRGRNPILDSTWPSTSIPGATSMSTRPPSSRAKTARSVM